MFQGMTENMEQIESMTMLFPPGGCKKVYEIYGEEGSGKTQYLHHLLALHLLPAEWNGVTLGGYNTGVVFMDNDYHLNMLRLTVIMENRIIEAFSKQTELTTPADDELDAFIKQCLQNVYIMRCSSTTQMVITLHSLEQLLKNKSNVSVLMIDSISAFYWIDRSNGGESVSAQETMLIKACHVIEKLKDTYNLLIYASKPAIFSSTQDEHCEYLCKSWQRLVDHRLIVSHYSEFHIKSDPAKSKLRLDANFSITETGINFINAG